MNKIKKLVFTGATTAIMLSSFAGIAGAAQPTNPGCFGTDRATYAKTHGSLGNDVGGVGYYASMRAGDNGTINQDYMVSCGGIPTFN